jgi:hypothetical protein
MDGRQKQPHGCVNGTILIVETIVALSSINEFRTNFLHPQVMYQQLLE